MATKDVIDEVIDILDDAEFQFSGNACMGPDGIVGLRLIANCLHARFDDWGAPRVPAPKPTTKVHRAIAVRKALKALARSREEWVVCYRLYGTDDWEMAWSNNLTPAAALDEMFNYIGHMPVPWD